MTMILANEIGRLDAYGSNAPTTGNIPMFDTATGKASYVTADQIASGASAVDGPASATDNAVARFDGTTGKLIQNSVVTIADTTGAIACGPVTQTGAGANTFNSTALDVDFTINKLTSGVAASYNAGTDAWTLDGTTVGITGATTITGDVGIAGATSELSIAKTTNQFVLGTTNTTTVNAAAPASSIVTNLPTVAGTIATTTGANLYYADITRASAQKDSTDTTLAAITGLSQTVVAGTYKFRCVLPGLADGTGGVKYAFKYTTTVLTSIEATGMGYTASAVAVQHTTTATDEATLFTQAAAVIMTIIEGSMVVGTGGTIALETAQEAANGTSSTYVGATMEFVRIA